MRNNARNCCFESAIRAPPARVACANEIMRIRMIIRTYVAEMRNIATEKSIPFSERELRYFDGFASLRINSADRILSLETSLSNYHTDCNYEFGSFSLVSVNWRMLWYQ